jgi:hypothetical protein
MTSTLTVQSLVLKIAGVNSLAAKSEIYSELINSFLNEEENNFSADLNNNKILGSLIRVVNEDLTSSDILLLAKALNVLSWILSCVWVDLSKFNSIKDVFEYHPELLDTLNGLSTSVQIVVDCLQGDDGSLVMLSLFILQKQSVPWIIQPYLETIVEALTNTIIFYNSSNFPAGGSITSNHNKYLLSLRALFTLSCQWDDGSLSLPSEGCFSKSLGSTLFDSLLPILLTLGVENKDPDSLLKQLQGNEDHWLIARVAVKVILLAPLATLSGLTGGVHGHLKIVSDLIR